LNRFRQRHLLKIRQFFLLQPNHFELTATAASMRGSLSAKLEDRRNSLDIPGTIAANFASQQ